MAMPQPNSSWPSSDWSLAYAQYARNDAFYSDDQVKLQSVFEGIGGGLRTRGDDPATHYNKSDGTVRTGGLRGILGRMFNGRIVVPDEARSRLHAPVASNIANLAADLLVAEPPRCRYMGADGKPIKGDLQTQLDKIMNGTATQRALSSAAEDAAGLSAVVLVANWDRANSDQPWLTHVACDAAVPEFVGQKLVAVNLYTMYPVEQTMRAGIPLIDKAYIHIERHEVGRIVHALFQADFQESAFGFRSLGGLVPFATFEPLAHLAQIPGSIVGDLENTIALPTGIDVLTASWWRHRRTKQFRRQGVLSMMGRAVSEGAEQFLDAIDETWSSWMRDLKLARARLIIPESFLDYQGAGLGGAFDDDREILTALNYTDLREGETITAQQFEIRAAEHKATLEGLTHEALQSAGYSDSSYDSSSGGEGGGATATEVVDRTTLTERTRDKQFLYFAEAYESTVDAMMKLNAKHYAGAALPADVTLDIQIPDLSQMDPEKEARVFQYLRNAMTASTRTLVAERNPDWDDTEIEREVTRIFNENGISDEAPPEATDGQTDPIPGEPLGVVLPGDQPADPGNGNSVTAGTEKIPVGA